ncbi:MAG: ABC transporter ATP-binding protein [Verrucomicrobiota bacterium]
MILPTPDQSLLADQLSVGYQQRGKLRIVLKDLELTLKPGTFVCLLGSNGIGKSTLLRTLAGIQEPISGELTLGKSLLKDIPPRERAQYLSIVFADSLPIGRMTVQDFVSLGRHPFSGLLGGLNKEDTTKIEWAIQSVDALELTQRQVGELSDGERQKVTIARALAQEAKLMLLDEPTAYLDLTNRVECMQLLRSLCRKESIGMLLSTHDLDLALRFADQLWLISPQGELVQGYPEELALKGKLQDIFKSEKLDWDHHLGTFRSKKTTTRLATLHGEGPERIWTQRALQRLGYEITSDQRQSQFRIEIGKIENDSLWHLAQGPDQQSFKSIEALISALEHLDQSG